MAQTASVLSNEQSIYINEELFSSISNVTTVESEDLVGYKNHHPDFYKVSTFYYNGRARLNFELTDIFAGDFVLVKGLLEFHRPKNLKFTFDREAKAFVIDLALGDLDQLNSLLSLAYGNVLSERKFKTTLRRVIQMERNFRNEVAEVYEALKTSSIYSVPSL